MLALMAGENVDRRRRYDDRMKQAGNVKRTYYVPADLADDMREVVRVLADPEHPKSEAVRNMINVLVVTLRFGGHMD
jgi:hypothetical protein